MIASSTPLLPSFSFVLAYSSSSSKALLLSHHDVQLHEAAMSDRCHVQRPWSNVRAADTHRSCGPRPSQRSLQDARLLVRLAVPAQGRVDRAWSWKVRPLEHAHHRAIHAADVDVWSGADGHQGLRDSGAGNVQTGRLHESGLAQRPGVQLRPQASWTSRRKFSRLEPESCSANSEHDITADVKRSSGVHSPNSQILKKL